MGHPRAIRVCAGGRVPGARRTCCGRDVMSSRMVLTLAGIIATAAAASHAQTSAEFEVASVKLNNG